MKGKFRILRRIGLGVFMVCALMLAFMPVAPVSAATAVEDVWVEFPSTDETGTVLGTLNYNKAATSLLWRIHFKATTALNRDVDTIIVQFPDGLDSTMGPTGTQETYDVEFGANAGTASYYDVDADAMGTTYSYIDCQTVAQAGYRVTVTTPVDIAAGSEAWLMIDHDDVVESGGTNNTAPNTAAYKVKVCTSQDTTPVLSHGFYHGAAQVTTFTSIAVSPSTAGSAGQYTFTFTPSGTLAANTDTITCTFPYGTTVPSSISASNIIVYTKTGDAAYTCGADAVVDTDLRTVKVTVPNDTTGTGCYVKFATAAGIINPTYGKDDYGEETATAQYRIAFMRTNDQPQDVAFADGSGYEITEKTATTLDFDYSAVPTLVTGLSDKYTMINMYSSPIYVQVEDQYGNLCDTGDTVSAQITLSSSSGSGNFYYDTYTQVTTTLTLDGGGKETIYYRDSTAGIHTLTASYTGLDDATQTMTVCPGASLYDRYDNLIHTYAPTATTPVEETAVSGSYDEAKGGYYIDQAAAAAAAYDVIVLGDGHYEVDNTTNHLSFGNSYLTIKSLNGADYTTLDGSAKTSSGDHAADPTIWITGSNVTIDGLTISNNPTGTEGNRGIYLTTANAFTIQNCKFIDCPCDTIINEAQADVTSGTITNNTFTGVGPTGHEGRYAIWLQACAGVDVSGVSITNNTFTNFNGIRNACIGLVPISTGTVTNTTISGNTMTNCYRAIRIYEDPTGLTGDYAIAENTITDCTVGLSVGGVVLAPGFNFKNNTISGFTKYGIYFNASTSLTGDDIYIEYNDITGTGDWAIYNPSTITDDKVAPYCKYNWYGDATGPSAGTGSYASTTARGSGEAVTKNVTFTPWLHKPLADVVADNASYQAVEMKLIVGWNTLSTPVPLIAAADSVDELISEDDMEIGYYYDATGWHQITDTYVLSPCDAVYVKMDAITYVLLKFDAGAFTTPSKDLAAGWNLASLAYLGYTSTVSTQMNADDAVASVALTAANLPGYSQVISPSINAGQTDIYGITGGTWAVAYGQDAVDEKMLAGLGYWIYMQNAATLAGFEITPIAPDLN